MFVQDYCRAKLGKLDLAIHPRSFQEVKARNAAGQCWLTLDGKHPCPAFTLYHRWALPCRRETLPHVLLPEPYLPSVASLSVGGALPNCGKAD